MPLLKPMNASRICSTCSRQFSPSKVRPRTRVLNLAPGGICSRWNRKESCAAPVIGSILVRPKICLSHLTGSSEKASRNTTVPPVLPFSSVPNRRFGAMAFERKTPFNAVPGIRARPPLAFAAV